jgi:hypothetical protein
MQALEAAVNPKALSDERHEDLLARALGLVPRLPEPAPLAEASAQEQREAARLALALEGQEEHELAVLARALACAHHPGELSELGLARALKRATTAPSGRVSDTRPALNRARWLKGALGSTAAVVALAATVTLFFRNEQPESKTAETRRQPEFATSRSLSPLFVAKDSQGTTTERMDRIVMARSRDLRHNRYLSWRVR